MEGIGFIHEKLDIKILILYILNHLPAAVDAQTLSDLVFCDNGIGYFDYSDCLAELVDTAQAYELRVAAEVTTSGSGAVVWIAAGAAVVVVAAGIVIWSKRRKICTK